ncbi:hypothetical protein R5R35_012813 [Gryllus longicercus]|uniref:Accessory gland protein n=1 Tax=Gryllus longicercus TaxID=2509291 RepID=A0AAN9V3M3_9ORTH
MLTHLPLGASARSLGAVLGAALVAAAVIPTGASPIEPTAASFASNGTEASGPGPARVAEGVAGGARAAADAAAGALLFPAYVVEALAGAAQAAEEAKLAAKQDLERGFFAALQAAVDAKKRLVLAAAQPFTGAKGSRSS